jgi:serine/threonine protein kinase
MKPGQEKDGQEDTNPPEDDRASRPPGDYKWLVPGSQTMRELQGEAEAPRRVTGELGPDPAAKPGGVAWFAGSGTQHLAASEHDPAGGPVPPLEPGAPLVGGTRILPDSQSPSYAPAGAGGGTAPGVGAGGTIILPDEPIRREVEPSPPGIRIPPPSAPPPASPGLPVARNPPPAPPPRTRTVAPHPAAAARAQAKIQKFEPGSRIGQYEIIRELGQGGMGVVFLARDDRLGRRVAIKFLQTGSADLTNRFLVEARATAQCSHENIVVIHEVGEMEGSPFMVLEYLQGQTLSQVIKKSGALPPTRAVELIASVVRALACAHEQQIVHRDLKPDNIVLTDSGTVKVLDFGIAKVLRDEHRVQAVAGEIGAGAMGSADLRAPARSGIIGTMAYMSPEQWGLGTVDARTDIWATGIILSQMLTGAHPLERFEPDPYGFVMQLDKPMPSIREAVPTLPVELAKVVDACLAKKHDDRLPDAASLLRGLEPFLPGRYSARPSAQIESGPYAGLRSFQEEDAGRFFGREREISALVTRIQEWPLLATVGPSGVGKSSFVRAGVVPALKASGEGWEALVVRPGRDPLGALASLLAPMVGTSSTVGDDLGAQKELAARLAAEPGYFGSALRSTGRRAGKKLLLFIDQFEELYTLVPELAARRAFTACLAAAADDATSPVRVIVSIRADFLGRVAEDPHFMNELAKGLFFLGPPSAEGLREAIVQPAEMAGYRFETPAIVDEMLHHLESTPGALPLLQFTAAQLWELRDPRRKLLTKASYEAMGGIAGALVTHADRVIAKLTSDVQSLARWLFPHLVTPERTRAVRDLSELREIAPSQGDLQRLIDHLVDSRLLVVQTSGGGATTVEIVHESLIGTWPTLRRWLDESHEESVFLDQLWAAAKQWQANKRARGLLWGGDIVDELARFKRRYRGELPDVVRAFSDAVFDHKARGARRRRRILSGAAVVGVGLLAAAGVALVLIHNAQKAAESNEVVAKRAEGEAQRRLHEVENKERERQKAEALQRVAEKETAKAKTQVELTNEELATKNKELTDALGHAKEQRERAEESQARAEASAWAAKQAKEDAQRSAAETAKLLKKERERADRLDAQLGTLVEMLR